MRAAVGVAVVGLAAGAVASATGSHTKVSTSPIPAAPPTTYPLPAHAWLVRTGAQLQRALDRQRAQNIVLADGVYALPTGLHFVDSNGSGLYAQHLGGAVLTTGLEVGGNGSVNGAVVQGLAFDVSNPANVFQSAEIHAWGSAGQNLKVLDSTFEGNDVIPLGLRSLEPQGLTARRLVFRHFTDVALTESTNVPVPYGTPTPAARVISDISVDGVTRAVPGSSDGTAEAGLWIGEPVRYGVHRIRVRNVAISGIETCNNAFNTTFTDLDIDMTGPSASAGVGVYLEHFSRHLVFQRFRITGASSGFKAEWDDGTAGNGAAHFTTIANGVIDAQGWTRGRTVGVMLDVGTESTTITGVTFRNQTFAGINAFRTLGPNLFKGNAYELPAGVPRISSGHR